MHWIMYPRHVAYGKEADVQGGIILESSLLYFCLFIYRDEILDIGFF